MSEPSMIVEFKNQRPIELIDFAASLSALGEEFKHFAADKSALDSDARLYVREMRPGSVIAELIYWSQQAPVIAEMAEHRELIAGFMASWQETLQAILNLSPQAKELPKSTVKNARNFSEVVAKDHGSQANFIANEGGVINNVFVISSGDAATIGYNAQHLLSGQLPEETRFSNEPMLLWRMQDGPPAKTGDWGKIDRFSDKPRKLTFGSDEVKRAILDRPEHPFSLIFFVSGVVKTANGKVVAYHVLSLDGEAPREDD